MADELTRTASRFPVYLTWLVMPFVAALLARWLYPSTAAGSARRNRRFRVVTRSP